MDEDIKDFLVKITRAGRKGDVAAVKEQILDMLEGQNFDINDNTIQRFREQETLLMRLVNIPLCVKLLMEIGHASITKRDVMGNTALFYATRYGCEESSKYLVEKGPLGYINMRNKDGNTALMESIRLNHVNKNSLKYLIGEGGADVNLKNNEGKSPLTMASLMGEGSVVKLLIGTGQTEYGLHVENLMKESLILTAAIIGDLEMLKHFAEKEMICFDDIYTTGMKLTPMMLSAKYGHIGCVQFLIKTAKVDILKRDISRKTALTIAAANGHVDCVKCLVETGKHDEGSHCRCLSEALVEACENGQTECVKFLLDKGKCDFKKLCYCYEDLLIKTARNGHLESVKFLVNTGQFDVNKKDHAGYTAFRRTVEFGHADCVKYFLENKDVDIHKPNVKDGLTALILAALSGHVECVKLLVKSGQFNIDGQDRQGWTGLMYACLGGFEDCVYFLVNEANADIRIQNNGGITALTIAVMGGSDECVRCIYDKEKIDMSESDRKDRISCLLLTAIKNGRCSCAQYLAHLEKIKVRIVDEVYEWFRRPSRFFYAFERTLFLKLILELTLREDLTSLAMKKQFLQEARDECTEDILSAFLGVGAFKWDWYPEMLNKTNNHRKLIRQLVIHGYYPQHFKLWGKICSPLTHALTKLHDNGLVCYLIANLYLTSCDLQLCSGVSNPQNLTYSSTSEEGEDLQIVDGYDCKSPWRLEFMSFVKVSSLLSGHKLKRCDTDDEDLERLGLPQLFRSRLLFMNPIRKLGIRRWDKINLDFIHCRFSTMSKHSYVDVDKRNRDMT